MADLWNLAEQHGPRQWGLVTRTQLAAGGFSTGAIRRFVEDHSVLIVRKGVYRFPGVPPSWEQALLAVILAGPPGTVASHRAAARLWHLRGLDAEVLELTTPARFRARGVISHLARHLDRRDTSVCARIPVTSVARTLCDLSDQLPPAALARALDEALRAKIVSLAEAQACLERLTSSPGSRGRPVIAPLLREREAGPALGDSPLEGKILGWLREANLPDPIPQYRLQVGRRHYRLDLAYPDLRVAIELDGWGEHGKRSAFEAERTRGNHVVLSGWLLLRFGDRHTRAEVVRTVQQARSAQTSRSGSGPSSLVATGAG